MVRLVRMTVLVKFVDSLFTVIYNIKFHRCPTRTDDLGYLKLRSCYASPKLVLMYKDFYRKSTGPVIYKKYLVH